MILSDQNNCNNTLLLAIKRTGTFVSMLPTVAATTVWYKIPFLMLTNGIFQ